MPKQTAKELLEIAANDIKEIDLSNYLAMYRINDIANQLIRASALLGEELFTKSDWCSDCGGAIDAGVCVNCGDDSNYKGDNN